MHVYLPTTLLVPLAVAALAAGMLVVGYVLQRPSAAGRAGTTGGPGASRLIAWSLLVFGIAAVHGIAVAEPAGVRMLALIACGLAGLKVLVVVEERARGMGPLSPSRWLGFAVLWPGMQPRLFEKQRRGPLPGAAALFRRGVLHVVSGAVLVALARLAWTRWQSLLLVSILLLPGLSLLLHFGVCNLLAGAWRLAGVACGALFRAPLRSQSLGEFWSRRWNLAFSEMTSIAVYRPLAKGLGRPEAIFAGFAVSGLLHEMAISLPVVAGFGLPLLYFLLHGGLVLLEGALARRGFALRGWPGRLWTLFWLGAPLPILFHWPFLAGVVWPLVGVGP